MHTLTVNATTFTDSAMTPLIPGRPATAPADGVLALTTRPDAGPVRVHVGALSTALTARTTRYLRVSEGTQVTVDAEGVEALLIT